MLADPDCDADGLRNSVDTDDDNDLLPDTLEATLKTDACNWDTDGDGMGDGWEYQSASAAEPRLVPQPRSTRAV